MESEIKQQENLTVIEGGTYSGTNLFHYLKDLSVPSDHTLYFNNSPDIKNIFIAIRDEFISSINGLIKANGTANLFLINPNGIAFGKNSSLDVGGSFLASTASSIKFADDFVLEASDSSFVSTSSSFPIGFSFASEMGGIQVKGDSSLEGISVVGLNQVFSSFSRGINPSGMLVKPGKTLGLLGGDLSLDGATLTAENGRIELGSFRIGSFVKLILINEEWNLDYLDKSSLKNIHLSKGTLIDASGISGGSIQVQGSQVRITDGSVLTIENFGSKENESLKINATESLEISGSTLSGRVASSVRTRGINPNKEEIIASKLADILISTKYLILKEGADIGSVSGNTAQSGNVVLNASESVSVFGCSPFNPRERSNIFATTLSTGKAGNLKIETKVLSITDNGYVSTSSIGLGAGGDLKINAVNYIEVDGSQSLLGTRALKAGNAGRVEIKTDKLVVKNGAKIDTSTLISGLAGSILIDANSVELSGVGEIQNGITPSSINSSANIPPKAIQKSLGVPAIPVGESGKITINVKTLSLTEGAELSVKNEGKANAGTIIINADEITSKKGIITANACEGKGGNIEINSTELFFSDSQIVANSKRGVDGKIQLNPRKAKE